MKIVFFVRFMTLATGCSLGQLISIFADSFELDFSLIKVSACGSDLSNSYKQLLILIVFN